MIKLRLLNGSLGSRQGTLRHYVHNSFRHIVDYCTNRRSHVFVCFADFSKAFDKVNYWKLFSQLIDLGVSTWIVSLLAYWYSHQQVCVNWHGKVSSSFFVGNGTKQGGLLYEQGESCICVLCRFQ